MKIPAKTVIPEIRLDRDSLVPLQRQLHQGLRQILVRGRLDGIRLPATRQFARRLGVSRNVVLFAYEELAADGLVRGRTGCGTHSVQSNRAIDLIDPDGHIVRCLSIA